MNIRPPAAFPPPLNASVILPDELIMEILSRLNVKSLLAMKCVCKSWNSLISHPIFVKMHLNISKRNPHLAAPLSVRLFPESNTVTTISVSRLLESTSDSIYRYFRFNSVDRGGIVGSCNGLICLHYYYRFIPEDLKYLFCFWNPATGTKSEPSLYIPWHWSREFRLGFGYDNSTDTYKLVMLEFRIDGVDFRNQVTTMVKVFTLGDNIWRDIQSLFPVKVVHSRVHTVKYDGVYLSNSISWLVLKKLTIKQLVIVSIDLGTETYSQLLLPSFCDNSPLVNPTLCVLMDSICFSHDSEGTHFVIWQMKEFGVEESWTQFLKISYLNLQINHELYQYGFQLLPLCLCESGATLILATTNATRRNQAILYSWRDNRVKKIENPNGIWWCNAKNYVESLVSTCLN